MAVPLRVSQDVTVAADGHSVTVIARAVVAGNPYQRGHFPGMPVVPGVFLLDVLRQVMADAFGGQWGPVADIVEVHAVRFLAPVHPGEPITMEIMVGRRSGRSARVQATCRVGDGVPRATMTVTVGWPRVDQ